MSATRCRRSQLQLTRTLKITSAQSPLFWGVLIAGLLVVYLLPSLIGGIRQVEGLGWLVAFNVLFPGVGWLAGMILACTLPRREPPVACPRAGYHAQPPRQYW